ncbi:BLUF domain-containing protein [Porphyrobacter sp. ULC335]|uniref:BLUF domain-containing protein n=1 Tax=Porphyrobacter sp. ULC335 TaxID=2854260 RepID=UPI00221E87AD|nr:BLUF domain-containing protein [Porphyrobacter sp. ULC335]UYV17286.1 BLUF domain-containing protein [Porphyrobacter sp. ULC335]
MFDEPGFYDDADLDPDAILLETFVYCSRATDDVDADEVSRLVAFSQKRNVARGITGVLVFGSGVFFQWIEGPPAEVRSLIANLHGDPRHYDIVTLDQCVDKRERLYPHWEMEQVAADDLREVLENALETTEDEASLAALQRILAHLVAGPLQSMGRS